MFHVKQWRNMLKLNERYPVEITGYTSDGEGVARIDGEVIFIPGVIAGEKCVIRIVNIGKTAAHGVLETLTEPSPHRVEPDCPYFGRCGGCDFRHMDYDEELRLKRQRVRDALERIGGFSVPELEITGAAVQNGYRNKVQFPVAQQKGRAVAGFYRAHARGHSGGRLQAPTGLRRTAEKGRDGLDARKPNPGLRRKKAYRLRPAYLPAAGLCQRAGALLCCSERKKNAAACGVGGCNSARGAADGGDRRFL